MWVKWNVQTQFFFLLKNLGQFLSTFFRAETPKIMFNISRNSHLCEIFTGQKTNRQLVKQGSFSTMANCLTKLPAEFRGEFGIFRGILRFWKNYNMISRGIPKNLLWKPKRETPIQNKSLQIAKQSKFI